MILTIFTQHKTSESTDTEIVVCNCMYYYAYFNYYYAYFNCCVTLEIYPIHATEEYKF